MNTNFTSVVYTNCLAFAEAHDLDINKILSLDEIISWNSETSLADADEVVDGHIDYIEQICKKANLI